MTWCLIPGTNDCYEYDPDTLEVRNAKTLKRVSHRVNNHGLKFVRISIGGVKRDLSLNRLATGFSGAYPEKREKAVCAVCGGEFVPSSGRARFCSRKCKKKNDNIQYNGFHIRRARKYGVPFESGITLPAVIERFGGVCQICGKPTDERSFASQPTIDHIVPMKRGGGHTWDNVQLACFKCNSIKAADECNEELATT